MMQRSSFYHAFGIDFQSEIALPEMATGQTGADMAVEICLRDAPCPQDAAIVVEGVRASPTKFFMDIPEVGKILVESGRTISVELAPGATEANIRPFLLGSAMGALIFQRGLIPIHASAIEIDGVAIAFAGRSGAGKSTLALFMNQRGHRLLCDDICAAQISEANVSIYPGLRHMKLWQQTLDTTGYSSAMLTPVLDNLDKFGLPIENCAPVNAYRLAQLFIIEDGLVDAPAAIHPMPWHQAAAALISNTYRGELVMPMELTRNHFESCALAAQTMTISKLIRPRKFSTMPDICAAIEIAMKS
jgi:hypothetical protein